MNISNFAEVFFSAHGFQKLEGKRKKVFLIPTQNCVLKLPKDNNGSEHNFGEWNFWTQSLGKPYQIFLQPTYFSFRHFDENGNTSWINIQQIGQKSPSTNSADFANQMLLLTDYEAIDDQHHFYNPDNFFFDNAGRIKIVDYGSQVTQELIKKYGERIYNEFEEGRTFSEEGVLKIVEGLEQKLSSSHI